MLTLRQPSASPLHVGGGAARTVALDHSELDAGAKRVSWIVSHVVVVTGAGVAYQSSAVRQGHKVNGELLGSPIDLDVTDQFPEHCLAHLRGRSPEALRQVGRPSL